MAIQEVKKSIHHGFDIELAQIYGVECAILIHHFQYWVNFNKKMKRNFINGRTWTRQTLEELEVHFPYWTRDKIRQLLDKLCHGKTRFEKNKSFEPVLIKGNFNQLSYDRTFWYTFASEEFVDPPLPCGGNTTGFLADPVVETPLPSCGGSTTPIPDNINNKTNTNPLPLSKGDEYVSFGEFVKIKHKEYEELCSVNTKEVIDTVIEEINDHLLSTGKKPYKNYAATIRIWLRRKLTTYRSVARSLPDKPATSAAKPLDPDRLKLKELSEKMMMQEMMGVKHESN